MRKGKRGRQRGPTPNRSLIIVFEYEIIKYNNGLKIIKKCKELGYCLLYVPYKQSLDSSKLDSLLSVRIAKIDVNSRNFN